jgi:cytidine deaminase
MSSKESHPNGLGIASEMVTKLTNVAEETAKRAYAPYSGLRIGAAVLTANGGIYGGCNVENASYGLTWCAERTALVSAVAAEGPSVEIDAIVIFTDDLPNSPPCGACRQVMAEFGLDAAVIFNTPEGVVHRTVRELLPDTFEFSTGLPA